jgi:glycerol-3-phosphate dehydrogenase
MTVQEIFATPRFRVYSNRMCCRAVRGAQNVIAIAAGILEGMGLGSNPRAR